MSVSEETQVDRLLELQSLYVIPVGRARRRTRRHSSDVILVDSSPADLPPAPRRLRLLDDFDLNSDSSVIDLTCADEVVDLTIPSAQIDLIESEESLVEIGDVEQESAQSASEKDPDSSQDNNQQPLLYCPICLEKYSKIVKSGIQLKSTICGHVFCATCIGTAISHSKKCPTCRKKLDNRKVHNLYLPL